MNLLNCIQNLHRSQAVFIGKRLIGLKPIAEIGKDEEKKAEGKEKKEKEGPSILPIDAEKKPDEKDKKEGDKEKKDEKARFPERAKDAPKGKDFMKSLEGLSREQREKKIYEAISSGNMPDFLRQMKPVEYQGVDANGASHKVKMFVMPDYLAVGANDDFVRMPMSPETAQLLAEKFNCVMPTKKIVDQIHVNAKQVPMKLYNDIVQRLGVPQEEAYPMQRDPKTGQMVPGQNGNLMMSNSFYQTQDELTNEALAKAGHKLGDIVSGIKKELVITESQLNSGRLCFYGGLNPSGSFYQTGGVGPHEQTYADYSHGSRLISRYVEVDGKKMDMASLMADPNLYKLVSDERISNAMAFYRRAGDQVPAGPPVVEPSTGGPTVGTPSVSPLGPSAQPEPTPAGGTKPAVASEPPKPSEALSAPPSAEPPATPSGVTKPATESAALSAAPSAPPSVQPSALPSAPEPAPSSVPATTPAPAPSAVTGAQTSPAGSSGAAPSYEGSSSYTPSLSPSMQEKLAEGEENPPTLPYTSLGDSFNVGIDLHSRGSFVRFAYHREIDPKTGLQWMVGKSTWDMKQKLDSEILPSLGTTKLKAIVIGGGGNDILTMPLKTDEAMHSAGEKVKTNLSEMYLKSRKAGLNVVAITMPPFDRFIEGRYRDPAEKDRHYKLWEDINAYIISLEGTENGPNKVVRAHELVGEQSTDGRWILQNRYTPPPALKDDLHIMPDGNKAVSRAIEKAINSFGTGETGTQENAPAQETAPLPAGVRQFTDAERKNGGPPPGYSSLRGELPPGAQARANSLLKENKAIHAPFGPKEYFEIDNRKFVAVFEVHPPSPRNPVDHEGIGIYEQTA
jgi:lysophospholipase L1-like esterase